MDQEVQSSEEAVVTFAGYGEVFYGKYAGTDVAIKQMYSVNNDCFLDEIQVLSKLSHPNIVLFVCGVISSSDFLDGNMYRLTKSSDHN